MAWTAPMTFVSGTVLTAAQLNTHLRDNLAETAPAKALTPGGIFVTNDVNQIVERVPKSGFVDPSQDTTSSSYTDLATVGPSVTTTTGTRALVLISAGITSSTTSASRASFGVSGASSIEPDDNWSIRLSGVFSVNCGTHHFMTDLSPGTNTFTMKYLSGSGSTSFFDRRITVIPMLCGTRTRVLRATNRSPRTTLASIFAIHTVNSDGSAGIPTHCRKND